MQHDLRTPINHVIGYAELLQEQASERGATTTVSDLKKIGSSAHVLLELLEMHLVRPQSGPAPWESPGAVCCPALDQSTGLNLGMRSEGGALLIVDDHPLDREMLDRRLKLR